VIELRSLNPPFQKKFLIKQLTRKTRKERVIEALRDLKKNNIIRDFITLYTTKKEIDFYIVYVGRDRYRVCPLLIKRTHRRHNIDGINEIEIDFWETRDSIKNKILEIIKKGDLKK